MNFRKGQSQETLASGIHHYFIEHPVEKSRVPLRLDADGSNTLIVNANRIMYLNPTAALMAKLILDGKSDAQISREIKKHWNVKEDVLQSDLSTFHFQLSNPIRPDGACPVHDLELDTLMPFSARPSAPYRLDLALTYRCNNDCHHCYNLDHPPLSSLPSGGEPGGKGEMDTEHWKLVIDKAWALGIPHIVFTSGEPTLRDDLPELIAHAEKNSQVCGLLTDGHKLADNEYLDTLLQTGLDHLMIILPSEGEPDWQAIQNALVADIFVALHLTVTPKNVQTVPTLMEKLHTAGVKAMSLSISDHHLRDELARLRDIAGEMGLRLVFDLPVPYSAANPVALEVAEDAEPAGAGKTWLYIEPDGDVLPAQGMAHVVLGNILKDEWEKLYSYSNYTPR